MNIIINSKYASMYAAVQRAENMQFLIFYFEDLILLSEHYMLENNVIWAVWRI